MRAALTGGLGVVLVLLLAGLALGFAGALHPAGDSLAVFRLQLAGAALAVALALAALAPRGRRFALAGLVAAGLALPAASGYGDFLSVPPGAPSLRLYQKNLNYLTGDLERIAADIRASSADIVTLQEVSRRNRALMATLAADYPAQAFCPRRGVGGMAVLSRLPAVAGEAPVCADGLAALRLDGPAGPVWAVSIHLYWPWPHGQGPQVAALAPVLAGLAGPVLVGGDFNMVPWGASVGRLAGAARARVLGPTATTFAALGPLVPLPIDHVLVPQGWAGDKTVRPELGSDHRGLLVALGLPAQAPASR